MLKRKKKYQGQQESLEALLMSGFGNQSKSQKLEAKLDF